MHALEVRVLGFELKVNAACAPNRHEACPVILDWDLRFLALGRLRHRTHEAHDGLARVGIVGVAKDTGPLVVAPAATALAFGDAILIEAIGSWWRCRSTLPSSPGNRRSDVTARVELENLTNRIAAISRHSDWPVADDVLQTACFLDVDLRFVLARVGDLGHNRKAGDPVNELCDVEAMPTRHHLAARSAIDPQSRIDIAGSPPMAASELAPIPRSLAARTGIGHSEVRQEPTVVIVETPRLLAVLKGRVGVVFWHVIRSLTNRLQLSARGGVKRRPTRRITIRARRHITRPAIVL